MSELHDWLSRLEPPARPASSAPADLSATDLVRLLADLAAEVRSGAVPPEIGRSVAAIVSAAARVLEARPLASETGMQAREAVGRLLSTREGRELAARSAALLGGDPEALPPPSAPPPETEPAPPPAEPLPDVVVPEPAAAPPAPPRAAPPAPPRAAPPPRPCPTQPPGYFGAVLRDSPPPRSDGWDIGPAKSHDQVLYGE
jgi:hypothetical protein